MSFIITSTFTTLLSKSKIIIVILGVIHVISCITTIIYTILHNNINLYNFI